MVVPNYNQADENKKRALAIKLIDNSDAFVSTQVINEVCSVLYRKAILYSEDMQDGLLVERKLTIVNPFK